MAEDLDKINEVFRLHDEKLAETGRMAAAEKEAARRNAERSAERVAEREIKAPAKEAR